MKANAQLSECRDLRGGSRGHRSKSGLCLGIYQMVGNMWSVSTALSRAADVWPSIKPCAVCMGTYLRAAAFPPRNW